MSYDISCTYDFSDSLDSSWVFSSREQFVTNLAFLLFLSITDYSLGSVSRKELATYFTFLWFLIDSFSSKKYIGHMASVVMFTWISCSLFLFKKLLDCISCICMVSLQYRFFLQKTNLNILQHSFRAVQLCTILAFIWFLSFWILLSCHNSVFMFFICKKMPACISCICTVSLQYKFFLQKTNLNMFYGLHNCVQSLHLYGFLHFRFFLLKQYFVKFKRIHRWSCS